MNNHTVKTNGKPYPLKYTEAQWAMVEGIKGRLLGLPKYAEILRAATALGLKALGEMAQDDLAKAVRDQ